MITQAIKRWLQQVFAWWPWRQSPAPDYSHPVSNSNMGAKQDVGLHTTMEGPASQPGTMSVAVEQSRDESFPDTSRSAPDDRSERPVQHRPPAFEESCSLSSQTLEEKRKDLASCSEQATPPTPEQRLEFLRYLVQHGYVNEDFKEGQIPDQYKNL